MSSADFGRILWSLHWSAIVLFTLFISFSNGLQNINDYREQHLNAFKN